MTMTENDYLALYIQKDPRFCSVEKLGDFRSEGELAKASPMAHKVPKDLAIDLAQTAGDMITDIVDNIFSILIVSQKARSIMEDEGVRGDRAEYLPIILRDKRGRPIKEPYFIVNVLTVIDCFDWKRSIYKTFKSDPREIMANSIKVLHLVPDAIPKDAKLFRVGEVRRQVVLRADLIERLKNEGCDGLSLVEMGGRRL
jgi:hypothetical protein